MKLNNKGFATTAIMYSILTLILMLLLGSMAYLANRKKVLDKIKQDTYNEVNEILSLDTVEYDYTGNSQTFKVLKSGYYKMEAWGAQGGSISTYKGGLGGYSSGYVYLEKNEKLYVYVGGAGSHTTSANTEVAGGYNGGGSIKSESSDGSYSTSGGGATDFRFNGTSLNDRIMVAGGGGGSDYSTGGSYGYGGAGGSLIAVAGTTSQSGRNGTGGTQRAGGTTYETTNYTELNGAFGKGGSTLTPVAVSSNAGGGGGGYYGGAMGRGYRSGGGGGSSFISGYAGVNAITSSSSTTPTNNTKHYSGKYFLGGIMKTGNELMPTHDGTSTMIGNSGNGYAKISYVGDTITRKDTRLNNVRYIKSCMNGNTANAGNHWVEIQAIKDGVNIAKGKSVTGTYPQNNSTTNAYSYVVDGLFDNITGSSGFGYPTNSTNSCITVDLGTTYNLDEIAAWNWWVDGRGYYNNIVSVSSNNSTWINIYSNFESETTQGKRINAYVINDNANYLFNYTGSSQSFTAPTSGYYKFEAWGASGGEGKFNTNAGTELGGMGAYTSGIMYLDAQNQPYLYIGGAGASATSNTQHATIAGGYNGGGNGLSGGTDDQAAAGGGATDIRYGGTSLNSRIMVAAGGGGGHCDTNTAYGSNRIKFPLMNGQGLMYSGTLGQWQNSTYSVSATQTSGNAFGIGGSHTNIDATHGAGGGGGGYYGGVANKNNLGGPGSGGTSYISGYAGVNSISSASSTSASNNTRHYSGKYFINGLMETASNVGNGKASITYLGDLNEEKVFNNNYQKLEYIQSTGTQYIDTGFKATPNTVVDIDFQFTEVSTLQQRLFGASTSNASYLNYHMYINGAGAWAYSFIDGSGNWATTNVTADTNKHHIRFNMPSGQFIIDNNSYAIASSTRTKTTETNMYIMNGAITSSPNAKMKLYAFKMYDKNELVRDMIPVKRKSDNAIGLYDKVTKKFYANAGTGTFTAGPVIDLTNVRYIKDCTSGSTANAYNHWVELQAIKDGVNLLKGKTATGIANYASEPLVRITDGDLTTANWASSHTSSTTECITLDLGSTYNLDEIAVWHYWGDSRVYKNHTLSVSNNNSTWRNLITSTEKETSQGKRVSAWNY